MMSLTVAPQLDARKAVRVSATDRVSSVDHLLPAHVTRVVQTFWR